MDLLASRPCLPTLQEMDVHRYMMKLNVVGMVMSRMVKKYPFLDSKVMADIIWTAFWCTLPMTARQSRRQYLEQLDFIPQAVHEPFMMAGRILHKYHRGLELGPECDLATEQDWIHWIRSL